MKCYICDVELGSEFKVDPRDLKPAPCGTCEEIIKDAAKPPEPEESGFGEFPVPHFMKKNHA